MTIVDMRAECCNIGYLLLAPLFPQVLSGQINGFVWMSPIVL